MADKPETAQPELRALAEAANAEAWMRNWWANDAPGWAASTIGVAEVGDWIAAATPDAVLALLDRVEAAERERDTALAMLSDGNVRWSAIEVERDRLREQVRTPPGPGAGQ